MEPLPSPVPAPGIPNTDWRIPISRRYYAQFPLPRNITPREHLPFPGPPHPSRRDVPARPLHWRRGRRLSILPPTPAAAQETTTRFERLDTPARFLQSIDTVMSEPTPTRAAPPQTPRANSWPPADLTPTAEEFAHNDTSPPDDIEGDGSNNSSPHPGSYSSDMSISPLTALPTPGMSRRNALPVPDPGLPDTPPPRQDTPCLCDEDDEENNHWTDEKLHGVADFDDEDIERARNVPAGWQDEGRERVSPRTRPSRFVEMLDVSAPEGWFDRLEVEGEEGG